MLKAKSDFRTHPDSQLLSDSQLSLTRGSRLLTHDSRRHTSETCVVHTFGAETIISVFSVGEETNVIKVSLK